VVNGVEKRRGVPSVKWMRRFPSREPSVCETSEDTLYFEPLLQKGEVSMDENEERDFHKRHTQS
jgi:hypothetical protein